jgi:hypothetical protein
VHKGADRAAFHDRASGEAGVFGRPLDLPMATAQVMPRPSPHPHDQPAHHAERVMTKRRAEVEPIDPSKLAECLRAAEQAHAVYEREELHGERDEKWADWYANYIAERMNRERGE